MIAHMEGADETVVQPEDSGQLEAECSQEKSSFSEKDMWNFIYV